MSAVERPRHAAGAGVRESRGPRAPAPTPRRAPTLASRSRVRSPRARDLHDRADADVQIDAGAAAPTTTDDARAPARPLRRAGALAGDDDEPRAGRGSRRSCRASRGTTTFELAVPSPTTSSSRPRSTSTRCPTAWCRSRFHFNGTIFYCGERRAAAAHAGAVELLGALPPAGRDVAPADRRATTRAAAGSGCTRTRSHGLRQRARRAGPADLRRVRRRSPAGTADERRVDELLRSLLYEGYALYPYTPGATKNATPTPFGIVYPPATRPAAGRPSTTCSCECRCSAATRRPSRPRCSSCRRRASGHQAVERHVTLDGPGEQAFALDGRRGPGALEVGPGDPAACALRVRTRRRSPDGLDRARGAASAR